MFPKRTLGMDRTQPHRGLAHAVGDVRLAAEHNGVTSLLWTQRCREIPKRPPAHCPQVRERRLHVDLMNQHCMVCAQAIMVYECPLSGTHKCSLGAASSAKVRV